MNYARNAMTARVPSPRGDESITAVYAVSYVVRLWMFLGVISKKARFIALDVRVTSSRGPDLDRMDLFEYATSA